MNFRIAGKTLAFKRAGQNGNGDCKKTAASANAKANAETLSTTTYT